MTFGRHHPTVEYRSNSLHNCDDVFTEQKVLTNHHVGTNTYPPQNDEHYLYDPNHECWINEGRTPSPTFSYHSVGTNTDSSVQGSISSRNIVKCTYRDFSGVPPTKEDLERYKNKKSEYSAKQKLASDLTASNESKVLELKASAIQKKGRGNKKGKHGTKNFVGFMGTNFPARLHDLLSHESGIDDAITWLPHGRSWIVRDKQKFLENVAPSHFQVI